MLSATLALAVSVTVGGAATSAFAAKGANAGASLKPVAGTHNKVAGQARGQIYVVQLQGAGAASYDGSIQGMPAPGLNAKGKPDLKSKEAAQYQSMLKARQNQIMASVGARPLYNYVNTINGFSAQMTPDQVSALKRNPAVVTIWKDEMKQLQTDTSGDFMGLTSDPGGLHTDGFYGEDIVVGIVDSGITPENLSFSPLGCPADGDPENDPLNQVYDCATPVPVYGPPPAQWNVGLNDPDSCQFGNQGWNAADVPAACNEKLLAARFYNSAFKAFTDLLPTEYDSARNSDDHGTHVAGTAAGNGNVPGNVEGADVFLNGIAPRARVAAYKSCWDGVDGSGCFSSDSAAAVDQAVADGVDVINFSVGGSSTSFTGPDEVAFLFAVDAGVFVANSAGNSGPGAATVGTTGPAWWISVGAMQDDAVFGDGVWWTEPGSISPVLHDALEGSGPARAADLGFYNANLAIPEDPANFTGCAPWINTAADLIALVGRGACSFQQKYDNAAAVGAAAILIFNDREGLSGMLADTATIPGYMVRQSDGTDAYLQIAGLASAGGSTENVNVVNATISPDTKISKADTMAGFSSRGPNGGMPDVIKPDVSAPGVDIGAAYAGDPGDPSASQFGELNGTSMASPHAAGLGALLVQAHPGQTSQIPPDMLPSGADAPQFSTPRSGRVWKVSWIKSAMMTTARNGIRNDTEDREIATPFDVGAGQIVSGDRANGNSRHPGLVYANDLLDQQAALCGEPAQAGVIDPAFCDVIEASGKSTDPSDLNLASLGIAELVGTQTVQRSVECTGPSRDPRTWNVKVKQPPGIRIEVNPATITCAKRESVDFEVTATITDNTVFNEWAFGRYSWVADDGAFVRSPIAIYPVPLAAPAAVQGVGTEGSATIPVAFGYDGAYTADMDGLVEGLPFPGAVLDGDADLIFFDVPPGTTHLTVQISDADVGDGNGTDDLDLQLFGPDTTGYPFICSSGGVTSEERCDIPNPAPGNYAFFVIDFASAPGPTPYTAFAYNLAGTDAGNTVVTAPAAAAVGVDSVTVDWAGLNADMKYRGVLRHGDGLEELATTEFTMDTR